VKGEAPFLSCLLESPCFPNQFLEHSLALLFSNDFMRETIKRIYLTGQYFEQKFHRKPFPKLLRSLGKLLVDLEENKTIGDSLVNFYFDMVSKDKRFGSYSIPNFNVSSLAIL